MAAAAESGEYVFVDGNPVVNIKLVDDPARNFLVIMKEGKLYKTRCRSNSVSYVSNNPLEEHAMQEDRASTEASRKNWRPQGVLAWLLAVVACLLAVITATVAFCMLNPVRWDGLGKFGALALFFPLHLRVVAVMAAVLAWLAWRCRTRLAAWAFSLAAILPDWLLH